MGTVLHAHTKIDQGPFDEEKSRGRHKVRDIQAFDIVFFVFIVVVVVLLGVFFWGGELLVFICC